LVNFALSGLGEVNKPDLKTQTAAAGGEKAEPKASRQVLFEGAYQDTPIYDRADLPAGTELDGPVVIEEFGSTIVVFPGQKVAVDGHGIMVVTSKGDAS